MKNIQDILSEMNNLNEQIATTLNEEEVIAESPAPLAALDCTNDPANASTPCASPHNRDIQFCCTIDIPSPFVVAPGATPIIIYDLSCLKCVIEECCCNGSPKHDIRIFGSIPFIANIAIRNTPGVGGNCVFPFRNAAGQLNVVSACCHGSICVDTVVCNKCTFKDAILACEFIRTHLNCDGVTVQSLVANTTDPCFVKVTGVFRLPACPSAAAVAANDVNLSTCSCANQK